MIKQVFTHSADNILAEDCTDSSLYKGTKTLHDINKHHNEKNTV